jgi:hypothetical protein
MKLKNQTQKKTHTHNTTKPTKQKNHKKTRIMLDGAVNVACWCARGICSTPVGGKIC